LAKTTTTGKTEKGISRSECGQRLGISRQMVTRHLQDGRLPALPDGLVSWPADCVLHSFRHTFGTRLGETGADAFTIMRLMGHSTVTVSQRYVHPSPEAVESAVSRMDGLNLRRVGVGTNLGTVAEAGSIVQQQVI